MIILTDKMLVIPVGISPNYAGAGNSDIKLQTKEVTITENGSKTVVPDENFAGFTKVNITTNVNPALEDKSVQITQNGDYNYTASAPYYGIGNFNVKVNVEIPVESSKTVNPSFNEDITVLPSEGFDAMSSVIVKKAEANLQDKTVDKASTSQIVLTADEGYQGLGTVTVAPIKTKTVSADPSTNVQEFSANTENNEYITSVTVNPVNTRSINVDPSTNSQVVNAPENEYITSVTVNPVGTKTVTLDPSTNSQEVNANVEGNEYISTVTVNPVGTKTVTLDPSTNAQTVNANVEGNEYITSVTVNPVKTKSLSITPRLVEQTFTAEQELYKIVNVSAVKYTEKTYDASTNTQTYDYTQNDYTFIKNLTINPVTSSIDPNIVPENIAKGVSILGVEGTVEEFQIENSKTVNPSFVEDVTVTPSEGFDAMSSVIVKKAEANLQDKTVDKASTSEIVLTADEGYQGLGTVTIAPIKTTSVTADPSTNVQDVNANTEENEYITSVTINPVTSSIDSNIVPRNIAKGVSILGVEGTLEAGSTPSTPTEAYSIKPTSGRLICPLTNVLLNETSWVSLDFAMDTSSLNKEKACLFGISASSLHCYLNNGVLHMYTGEEVPMNKQITLDTNRHTLEFGFVTKADASGHAEFEVFFDGEMIADVMVIVPKFNLPLSLFDIALSYNESYESYLNNGGITHIVNGTGYGAGDSVFDLFSLTVYDKPGYYRETIHAFTPSLDANNKPIFIDNITGEYQYPASGTYSYSKIDGNTRTEIASATYTMPFSNDFQYFRPSASAIIPTDIELPALHRITMYINDIDSFDGPADGVTEHAALDVVKSRVMIGAQPVLVAPFNHLDYERSLPRLPINDENTAIIGDTSIGLFNQGAEVYSTYTYSIYSDGNSPYSVTPQALASLNGEHTIRFGQRANSIHYVTTFFTLDDNQGESHTTRGMLLPNIIDIINERKMTPLCIFGTYNFVEGTKPDYVNSLGYQEALNQIGYTTGVRYAVKQIDIEEYPLYPEDYRLNPDDINALSTLRHRLVTFTDNSGVNCLFDTITGTSYYPYNGTLDAYNDTILTDTYIKPSEGAIVPTDIKFTSLTNVTMHVKGFDSVNVAESNMDSRAMIGAQPNFIVSPFSESYSSSNIGIYFNGGGNDLRSTETTTGNTPGVNTPLTLSKNGEHVITVGYEPKDINKINTFYDKYMWKIISIDEQGKKYKKVGDSFTQGIYRIIDNQMTTPICIFGNYNNPNSMTPDDVIALGYENALSQIGYVTGARYGVKQIDINVYNTDGSMTTTHSLVPYRDKDGIICLYDTISNKSYYPFHGTLDII